ncbi:hypothetical protein BAY59_22730 [Prauserella coralliicola]|nr:hypothetical protein BAY59_22730 [Prauserella coralliicola]
MPNLNYDIGTSAGLTSYVLPRLWGGWLYRTDWYPPRKELIPEIATAMPEKVDDTTYRIKIRDNGKFHNSKPITAEDVVFTIDLVKKPEASPYFAQFLAIIDQANALSDTEIEIKLTTTTTLLAERLSLITIRPKGMSEPFGLKPISAGPYRVVSATSDREVVLEKFDDYVGDRKVNYERIQLSIATEGNARISGLQSGRFKIVERVPPSAYDQLRGNAGLKAEGVDTWIWIPVSFNCSRPPFDDVRTRQAVAYGIDRDAITEASHAGMARPAWFGPYPEDHPEFIKPRTVYRYDAAKARSLLADAGYADRGTPIDVLVPSGEVNSSQGPIVEQNLRSIGFKPNMIPSTPEASASRQAEGRFDMVLSDSGGDNSIFSPSLEFLLRFSFTGFVSENLAQWKNEKSKHLVEILDNAVRAADDAERKDYLAQAMNIVQDEIPFLALHHLKLVTGWSDQVKDFKPLPTYGLVVDGAHG